MSADESAGKWPQPPVYRVLLAESGLLVFATIAAWLVNATAGSSILIGGLIFLLPQAWFAWRVFRHRGAKAAAAVVQGFYRGEAAKFLLTGAAFAAVFAVVKPLDAVALFGAYIGLLVTNAVLMSRLK